MTPEEKARVKIDKQLRNAGWDIVSRDEYIPSNTSAVKEALMQGNKESDYLLFVDDRAIAVVEAKKEENSLGNIVAAQAEAYSKNPQSWYPLWFDGQIPLVYLANGNKIYFKNMIAEPDGDYVELTEMHSPKKMLQIIGKKSEYGALPRIEKRGLRDCQYDAAVALEKSLKAGQKKALAVLATGSGKTYLACLATYRLLNYTPTKRVLFLVDRNNLARQTETEFSLFDRTERQQPIYTDLYPDREENWKYIPKTLIFAKDDNHATQIVNVVKEVFKEKFEDGKVPEKFVQKITYSAGDSNALIRDLRTEKDFRIAVTVTLVAPFRYFKRYLIFNTFHRSILELLIMQIMWGYIIDNKYLY